MASLQQEHLNRLRWQELAKEYHLELATVGAPRDGEANAEGPTEEAANLGAATVGAARDGEANAVEAPTAEKKKKKGAAPVKSGRLRRERAVTAVTEGEGRKKARRTISQNKKRGRRKGSRNKAKPEVSRKLGEATLHYAHDRFEED